MNGIHDMGGMTDFGRVDPEPDEPLFHAEWERRVLGLVRTIVDRRYNWDEFRFAIERLDPLIYLSAGYYERWLNALERYLVEKGELAPDEMERILAGWRIQPGRPLPDADAPALEAQADTSAPRFCPRDRVRARNLNPAGHTRLPRYVRGKTGEIERVLGRFIFPDANALGQGERREPCYAVRFAAAELWGPGTPSRDSVCVDLWESYLTPAEESSGALNEGAA